MRFRFLLILLLFNYMFSQALLNRISGEELLLGSSRSYAMGLTHSINSNNSSLIRYNPSLLGFQSMHKRIFDFQINLSSIKERRSILTKDYFGDFLTYADYASNDNIYNYFQGGFITNIGEYISFGASILPLTSFNYDYTEEVRGSADIEDGDVGIKDPLVGYHVFNTSGKLNTFSFGFSYFVHTYTTDFSNDSKFNVGFGYHKVVATEIIDDIHIDSLTTEIENLSSIQNYYSKQSFEDLNGYSSLGISYTSNNFLLSLNFEPDVLIQKKYKPFNFIDSIGAISYLDSAATNFILEGISYYKPQRVFLGISYKPKNNSNLTISTEIESNKINNKDKNHYLKDHIIYKVGFEYILPSLTPVRAGLAYKTSPIILLPDQSIITYGTGGNFKNIFYDIGISYTFFDYYYPDFFPLSTESNDGLDEITESKLNINLTLRYLFK